VKLSASQENKMGTTAEGTVLSGELKSALHQYYEQQEIAVGSKFRCPHSDECERAVAPKLLMGRGSEAYVGSRYGDRFKIVVVGLDRGEGAEDVWGRSSEIEGLPTDGKGLNPQMKGTLVTLRAILREDECENIWTQFAMINAAKCCYGNRRTVPDPLYCECSGFGFGELSLLSPQIIVTQGKNAKKPVELRPSSIADDWAEYMVEQHPSGDRTQELVASMEWMIDRHIHEIVLGERKCLWLETPHPADRAGRWHPFANVFLPILGRILHDEVIAS
jgi:hypothetical protein